MKTDIQIAQENQMIEIDEVAKKLAIKDEYIEKYGKYKAKIDFSILNELEDKKDGKLILVTAINPTPAGEGKTTTTVGLGDALNKIGKKTSIALREPSLGPVFGIKGGAAGGGFAQVVPMEDINLHFTGDIHAIGAANNLLAALLDNHMHQGNALGIDSRKVVWKRVMDMNDRQLRYIVSGLKGRVNGVPREDGFDITVASEIMAILCLASSIKDLKEKLAKIVVAYDFSDQPVTAGDLKAEGAMAALLKDAIKPNLVQTLEKNPAFIHGGPFANIAHGCNSLMATKIALKLSDYVVTEAGFGADLGAEKFLDIKCRLGGLKPDAVVIVATVRALKHHGGAKKDDLNSINLEALEKGLPNLLQHIKNIQEVYGLNALVAINKFPTDSPEEIQLIREKCEELGVTVALSDVWAKGSAGALELAEEVLKIADQETELKFPYSLEDSIEDKILKVVRKVYHGENINFSKNAKKDLLHLESLGFNDMPICIAKTQYSFSDDAQKLGAPSGFDIDIQEIKISAGAGFLVVLTGNVMTMPGLSKKPSAENIDVDDDGRILGLF